MKNDRTIKFRAWDGVGLIPDYAVTDQQGRIKTSWEGHDTDLRVTQYTGLDDKSGHEIYEGDIIEYEDVGSLLYSGHYVVRYENGQFYPVSFINGTYNADQPDEWRCENTVEVVGNKFEHPELLKAAMNYN